MVAMVGMMVTGKVSLDVSCSSQEVYKISILGYINSRQIWENCTLMQIEVLQNNILDWGTGAQDVVIAQKTYLVVPKRTTQESYSFAKLSIAADQKNTKNYVIS